MLASDVDIGLTRSMIAGHQGVIEMTENAWQQDWLSETVE